MKGSFSNFPLPWIGQKSMQLWRDSNRCYNKHFQHLNHLHYDARNPFAWVYWQIYISCCLLISAPLQERPFRSCCFWGRQCRDGCWANSDTMLDHVTTPIPTPKGCCECPGSNPVNAESCLLSFCLKVKLEIRRFFILLVECPRRFSWIWFKDHLVGTHLSIELWFCEEK